MLTYIGVHELRWLLRRRDGLNVQDAAKRFRITPYALRQAERDGSTDAISVYAGTIARIRLSNAPFALTKGECAAICRRRSGASLPAVATLTLQSRVTVWKAEHDQTTGVDTLLHFWATQSIWSLRLPHSCRRILTILLP